MKMQNMPSQREWVARSDKHARQYLAVLRRFEPELLSWRGDAERFAPGSNGVVLAATSGALNVRLTPQADPSLVPEEGDPGSRPEPQLAHLGSVVGLVWRAVVLWMLLLALVTLARF